MGPDKNLYVLQQPISQFSYNNLGINISAYIHAVYVIGETTSVSSIYGYNTFSTAPYTVKYIVSSASITAFTFDSLGNTYYAVGTAIYSIKNFTGANTVFGDMYLKGTTASNLLTQNAITTGTISQMIVSKDGKTLFYTSASQSSVYSIPIPVTTTVLQVKLLAGRNGETGYTDSDSLVTPFKSSVTKAPMPGQTTALNNPTGIATDSFGSLFIADSGNFVIRKIANPMATKLNDGTSIYTPSPSTANPVTNMPILTYSGTYTRNTAKSTWKFKIGSSGTSESTLASNYSVYKYTANDGASSALVNLSVNMVVSYLNSPNIQIQCQVYSGLYYVGSVPYQVFPSLNSYWTPSGVAIGVQSTVSDNMYLLKGKASFKVQNGDSIVIQASNTANNPWSILGGSITITKQAIQAGGRTTIVSTDPRRKTRAALVPRKSSLRLKNPKVKTKKVRTKYLKTMKAKKDLSAHK